MTKFWFAVVFIIMTISATTAFAADSSLVRISATALRAMESDGKELAILDPREEGIFGKAHLLYAVNMPLSKLEINIFRMVPRNSTRIVLTDGGEGMSERAAAKLKELGYTDVAILDGGYPAWKKAGLEVFSGMSVAGKAFGEWIAVNYQPQTMTPEEVQKTNGRRREGVDPGQPPVERVCQHEHTRFNQCACVGTRVPLLPAWSQSRYTGRGKLRRTHPQPYRGSELINAGIPNKVAAMRGGTMAWQMAGFQLEHGSTRHAPEPWGTNLQKALQTAQKVADRFGVKTIDSKQLEVFKADKNRSSLHHRPAHARRVSRRPSSRLDLRLGRAAGARNG